MIHGLVNRANEHLKEFKEITGSIQKEFSETADTSTVEKRGKRWSMQLNLAIFLRAHCSGI